MDQQSFSIVINEIVNEPNTKTFCSKLAGYLYPIYQHEIIYSCRQYYKFEPNTGIWYLLTNESFQPQVIERLEVNMTNLLETTNDQIAKAKYLKVRTHYKKNYVIKTLVSHILHDCEMNVSYKKIDVQTNVINFLNGLYNLETGEFRNRVLADYVTKVLPYDYVVEPNNEVSNDIQKILFEISNCNPDLVKFNLAWFGYCLTGAKGNEKVLFVMGSGSNGRTTLGQLYGWSLPIYFARLNGDLFSNYKYACKAIPQIQKPVRFCMVDGLDQGKIQGGNFKAIAEGEVLDVRNYGLVFNSKFFVTSDHVPNLSVDPSVSLRVRVEVLNNKFVSEEDYGAYQDKTGIYLCDENLQTKFNSDVYKMEFVRLLLPYAKQFYESGLNTFGSLKIEALHVNA